LSATIIFVDPPWQHRRWYDCDTIRRLSESVPAVLRLTNEKLMDIAGFTASTHMSTDQPSYIVPLGVCTYARTVQCTGIILSRRRDTKGPSLSHFLVYTRRVYTDWSPRWTHRADVSQRIEPNDCTTDSHW